jgi:hypothetical protein
MCELLEPAAARRILGRLSTNRRDTFSQSHLIRNSTLRPTLRLLTNWVPRRQTELRNPMKSPTCSGHVVHPSERMGASMIIVPQVVAMGKGAHSFT